MPPDRAAAPQGASGSALALALALALVLAWAPVPLASNRPGTAALLAGLLFALAAATAALGGRVPPTAATRTAAVLALAALGWAVVQALPGLGTARPAWSDLATLTGRAGWQSVSLTPLATADGLLRLAAYATAAWLGAALGRDERALRWIVGTLAATAAVLAAYALMLKAAGSHTLLWWDKWIYQDVTTATFVNRNAWCLYAGLGAAAALLAAGPAPPWARRIWHGAAAVCLLAAVLSESRWGLACVGAGLTALALLRPGRPPWGRLAAGVLTLAAAPVVLALLGWERFLTRFDPAVVLGDLRWDLYRATMDAIAAAPWTGHGLGSFPVVYHHVRDAALADALVFQAHSVPLELLAELGGPAALAWMGAYAILVLAAARHARRSGATAARLGAAAGLMAGLHGLLDFSLQTPALTVTVLVLLGAGATASRAPAPAPAP